MLESNPTPNNRTAPSPPQPPKVPVSPPGGEDVLIHSSFPHAVTPESSTPAAVPGAALNVLYHHTSPYSLPLVFEYGLYLSAVRFTTFNSIVPREWGWTSTGAAIAFKVPADRCSSRTGFALGLGSPDAVVFPDTLRTMLTELDRHYDDGDRTVGTSRKSREYRAQVNGAHRLLIEERKGTLRHFPVETFDIALSRKANEFGKYRLIVNAYLDVLEANGGQPVIEPVKVGTAAIALDRLSYWWKNRAQILTWRRHK